MGAVFIMKFAAKRVDLYFSMKSGAVNYRSGFHIEEPSYHALSRFFIIIISYFLCGIGRN